MGLSLYSQRDTISYPKIAYPGNVVKDTCVEILPYQAKLSAEDAINAVYFKQEVDSCNHIVSEQQKYINLLFREKDNLNFTIMQYKGVVEDYKKKEGDYNDVINYQDKVLKRQQLASKIGYPAAIVVTGLIVGLTTFYLIHH